MKKPKRLLMSMVLIFSCTWIYAQGFKATGTVVSADDNLGIIGATVTEKRTLWQPI